MIYKCFSIFDSKSEAFMLPFTQMTQGEAIRAFSDVCNDPDHAFARHPGDYTLFDLGCFDTDSGKFTNHDTPISLGLALQHIRPTDIGDAEILNSNVEVISK